MKKLLMGIFGLTLLLPFGVYAEEDTTTPDIGSVEEGNNTASTTVTIGNVEVPVYNVSIVWQNTVYDWTYEAKSNTYGWTPQKYCIRFNSEDLEGKSYDEVVDEYGTMYSDNECLESTYDYEGEYLEEDEYYYLYAPEVTIIGVEDYSKNGAIVPSVSWESSEDYNYVEAKFSYSKLASVCKVLDQDEIETAQEVGAPIYTDECNSRAENIETEKKYYAYVRDWQDVSLEENVYLPLIAKTPMMGGGVGYIFTELFPIEPSKYPGMYNISMKLENNTEPTTTPKAGDTLGTITVAIKAAE